MEEDEEAVQNFGAGDSEFLFGILWSVVCVHEYGQHLDVFQGNAFYPCAGCLCGLYCCGEDGLL